MRKGDIFFADLSPVIGSEQGGSRPVIIIQNDVGNRYSPTVIVAIATTRHNKKPIPTHYWLEKCDSNNLPKDSMVMLEQIRTIDKRRLKEYCGRISQKDQEEIDKALKISLAL